MSSLIQVIPASAYRVTPWKNGQGTTQDVLLLPEGSSHETFDIRLSLAPISEEGSFSSFLGIDRTITLLNRSALTLVFEDGVSLSLERLQPVSFDSGLAPRSRLPSGPVRVLNVMTRRGRWESVVTTLRDGAGKALTVTAGEIALFHAVAGRWNAVTPTGTHQVPCGETLMAQGPATLALGADGTAEALLAVLSPASSAYR